ncbi:uncharacterized protein L3040_005104 [Drepanopeziza brunnea f. sp. 'multigermtubi']|uniref:uncharacterized protein n=1 Tax=Drepanopeziza brunnea f. sp. 'multigermtubi' TaxID=698441 RepID=UPI0023828C30|nr:hypothetical protein L3040_005104 [Drepanopeziza brunnea f. sp. 'multigermtubi']
MRLISTVTIVSGAKREEIATDRQKHRGATIAAVESGLPAITGIPTSTNTIPLAKQCLTADCITEFLPTRALEHALKRRQLKGNGTVQLVGWNPLNTTIFKRLSQSFISAMVLLKKLAARESFSEL